MRDKVACDELLCSKRIIGVLYKMGSGVNFTIHIVLSAINSVLVEDSIIIILKKSPVATRPSWLH